MSGFTKKLLIIGVVLVIAPLVGLFLTSLGYGLLSQQLSHFSGSEVGFFFIADLLCMGLMGLGFLCLVWGGVRYLAGKVSKKAGLN